MKYPFAIAPDEAVRIAFDEPRPTPPVRLVRLVPEDGVRNVQPATAQAVMATGMLKTLGVFR